MTDLHLHCLGFRRAAPPPVPLWVLQRTTEGLGYKGTRTTVGGAERGRERIGVEKRKREREGKEGGEVTRAVRGAPNQRCVNRPPPGVDRLQGGVLHGPLGLSAEQITDGRNVAFVLKKRVSGRKRRREGRGRSSTSGRKRGRQLTSTWCIRTAGPLAP